MPHANSLANLRVGGGRPLGQPNKLGASIKEMVEKALEKAGGVEYLTRQAEQNPVAFMGLVGRILPLQLTGANGGAINWVIRVPSEPGNAEEWFATYAPQHIQAGRKTADADKEVGNGQTIDGKAEEPAK